MYERFFGLSDAPFRLTPAPRYPFLSNKHTEALAHLKLGLHESGFVCITGDVGTGKTTLLRTFLGQLGDEIRAAYVFNPALSSLELLQTICAEFGLPATSQSPKELIDGLNAHLLAERAAGRRCVVVVDEAQALGIEVLEQLRLLSNLETATEKLLRMILVGQPQLRRLLLHPELVQLNQRITLRWHMGPLDAAETAAYVRHRLAIAGGAESRQLFSAHALGSVHRVSGGVPRLINMICHRALLAAFAAEQPRVTAAIVRQAHRELDAIPLSVRPSTRWRSIAAAVAAVLAVAVGIATWWGTSTSTPARTSDASSPPEALSPTAPVAAASTPPTVVVADPPATVSAAPPTTPPEALDEQLARLDRRTSERGALTALLEEWQAAPLKPNEASDLRAAADVRALEYVAISGNLSMLKLLDLPAILEVAGPRFDGLRHLALVGLDDGRPVVVVDGRREPVEQAALEAIWRGRAHLLWRDFDGLGAAPLGPEATGRSVRRLQALLERAGIQSGPATTSYDRQIVDAVQAFQTRWFLTPDGRVGPLTSIALYAAAGGYSRPSLSTRGRS